MTRLKETPTGREGFEPGYATLEADVLPLGNEVVYLGDGSAKTDCTCRHTDIHVADSSFSPSSSSFSSCSSSSSSSFSSSSSSFSSSFSSSSSAIDSRAGQIFSPVDRIVGLVVRRPPRERKIPGSNPACAGTFSGSSHTSDLKFGTPVATKPGAWRCSVSAGTGRPGVSIL